jgi:SAM-dependent methyltransferase
MIERTWEAQLTYAAARVADPAFKRTLLCCSRYLDPVRDLAQFNAAIHSDDQMFTHSLREHQDADAALSQYFNLALQQYDCARQVLTAAFEPHERVDFLDFACGFGRLLRLIVLRSPRDHVFAAEIQRDALDFVGSAFGVRTLPSGADPRDFAPGLPFDFIWVSSLFSHLPEELFTPWLARLLDCLNPRGVLCFSIRGDECLSGEALPAAGILYQARSENTVLSTEIYGTTYVSESYVRDALRRATGRDCRYQRLRRALANEQDLYVVANDARELRLACVRRGMWGWVDRRVLSRSGELYLEGWAGSLDDGAANRVEVTIDGELHVVRTNIPRPDVSAAFADARVADSGWALRRQVPAGRAVAVDVIARGTDGSAGLLYTGTVCAV